MTSGTDRNRNRVALRFVLTVGVMSFFADFTYEGARSIVGPYLATLGAGALAVGAVSGLGELLGYGLRLFSGPLADRMQKYWPVIISGYLVQMSAVPLLALAGSWPAAAVLIAVERAGKATRNPPRDVMLSHAAAEMGYGWGFGVHEALDQAGALFGPLAVAGILAVRSQGYRLAFGALALPAVLTLAMLTVARFVYPHPERLASPTPEARPAGLPKAFPVYLAAAGLIAAGFADFSLISYQFHKAGTVSLTWVPLFYAAAMAVSGAGSLLFGRLFDRYGVGVLIPLTIVAAGFAPLVFWGTFPTALVGTCLWGLGTGVHEAIIPAAVAPMVPAQHRASAYGIFTAGYGLCWFLGSLAIGGLLELSLTAAVAFCVAAELAAVLPLVSLSRLLTTHPRHGPAAPGHR